MEEETDSQVLSKDEQSEQGASDGKRMQGGGDGEGIGAQGGAVVQGTADDAQRVRCLVTSLVPPQSPARPHPPITPSLCCPSMHAMSLHPGVTWYLFNGCPDLFAYSALLQAPPPTDSTLSHVGRRQPSMA